MPGTKRQLKRLKGKSRWVDRAFDKERASTPDKKSHFMMHGETDDGFIVFPSVREEDGQLVERDGGVRGREAMERGDALNYKTEKKAEKAAAYGYKKHSNFSKQDVKEAKTDYKKFKKKRRTDAKEQKRVDKAIDKQGWFKP